MYDAFGVERPDLVEKGWKGEPGDKRNTKYAASTMVAFPVGTIGYAAYRQSKTSKRNRAESIAEKKRSKKIHKAEFEPTGRRGDKRNTKYAAAAFGGSLAGAALGPAAGRKASGMTKEQVGSKSGVALERYLAGDPKGAKKVMRSGKMGRYVRVSRAGKWVGAGAGAASYAAYRQSKSGKENRKDSIRAKKHGKG